MFIIGETGTYLLVVHLINQKVVGLLTGCVFMHAPVVAFRLSSHWNISFTTQWLPYLALFSNRSLKALGSSHHCE